MLELLRWTLLSLVLFAIAGAEKATNIAAITATTARTDLVRLIKLPPYWGIVLLRANAIPVRKTSLGMIICSIVALTMGNSS
jgi:hypothetical protein